MDPLRADRLLAIVALTFLGVGCVYVLWPFMSSLAWAAILASTCWPLLRWLDRLLGGRRVLAAGLVTAVITLVVLGPVTAVAFGLAENVAQLGRGINNLVNSGLPDAPAWLRELPLIGQSLFEYWQRLAHDGKRLMAELSKLADPAQKLALTTGRLVGKGVIDIALSVFLAFFLFLHGESLAVRLRVALSRLAGPRASYLIEITQGTVNGVIYGILGTALAQGVLAAIGFLIAGVPAAISFLRPRYLLAAFFGWNLALTNFLMAIFVVIYTSASTFFNASPMTSIAAGRLSAGLFFVSTK